jgi:hypothetical protein
MSRTFSPNSSSITSFTSLLTLRNDPPDKLISKTRLELACMLSHPHLHDDQWLHHLLLIYRLKLRTASRRYLAFQLHI